MVKGADKHHLEKAQEQHQFNYVTINKISGEWETAESPSCFFSRPKSTPLTLSLSPLNQIKKFISRLRACFYAIAKYSFAQLLFTPILLQVSNYRHTPEHHQQNLIHNVHSLTKVGKLTQFYAIAELLFSSRLDETSSIISSLFWMPNTIRKDVEQIIKAFDWRSTLHYIWE